MTMQKFFATFGHGQYGGLLKYAYLEVHAPNEHEAAGVITDMFGNKWAGLYPIEELPLQVERFKLWRLGAVDQHGNIISIRTLENL